VPADPARLGLFHHADQRPAPPRRRGVPVGEIDEHPQGVKYVPFSDPDGNTWVLQEMPWRAGDFASAE
jgi:catechol 2,3-dioxygenase-like lactoylglutathione lyase family enzyme